MSAASNAATALQKTKLTKLTNENKKLKKELADAKKEADSMLAEIDLARDANRKRVITNTRTKKIKDDWVRLIVPDVHGSGVQDSAINVMFNDIRNLNIDEIVLLGDFIDCGGLLAQNYTLGYVSETSYTYEDDVAMGNRILDKLFSLCPEVKKFHYIEGNHEHRVEKFCITSALRKNRDAKFLLSKFGPKAVLDLERRGIKYYRECEFFDGLSSPGTIKLGSCHYTHGISAAKHAAALHATRMGGNIVYGHTHRMDTYETKTLVAGQIGAWCPGCLCKLQPGYARTNVTGWTHGYGLQVVARSGLFQTLMIRIINNESMLIPVVNHILTDNKKKLPNK